MLNKKEYLQKINITQDTEIVFSKNFENYLFKNKKFFTIHPHEIYNNAKILDDKSISYILNDDFFRCDNFKKNHVGFHILFAGCSETEGLGGNLEEVWAYDLYKKLSEKNKISGYFNIGRSAYNWQKIILNFMIYIEKYGNPDYFIVMLPNVARGFFYDTENNSWYYQSKTTCNMTNKEEESSIEEEKMFFINFVIGWQIVEQLCKQNNIKLFWSTWDYSLNKNIKNLKDLKTFNNFISINTKSNEMMNKDDILDNFINLNVLKNNNFLKNTPQFWKKRDGHQGTIFHLFWSHCFFNNITENGVLK